MSPDKGILENCLFNSESLMKGERKERRKGIERETDRYRNRDKDRERVERK